MYVDLRDPAFLADPYPRLAALRRLGVVHETFRDVRLVLTYEQVNRINRDPHMGRDPSRWSGWETVRPYVAGSPLEWAAERFMLNMDPPMHTRLRRLVSQAFTPRTVADLRETVGAVADDLLNRMVERAEDGFADLMALFARPLPARIILALLGLPESDLGEVEKWSYTSALTTEPTLRRDQAAEASAAVAEMLDYLKDIVAVRRSRPGAGAGDLLGALLRADADGAGPSSDELLSMLAGLIIAGHTTTINLIGNGVLALARCPDQWELLRSDPAGVAGGVVEEVLRYDSPVQTNPRVAHRDLDIGGTPVAAGTLIWGMTGAANRDPAVFDRPDRFDVTRTPNPHLAFGGGAHFCLGAGLARLEGEIAFTRLGMRFPGLEIDESGLRRRPLVNLRGLECLPVRTKVAQVF
jgi:cytochrome P450